MREQKTLAMAIVFLPEVIKLSFADVYSLLYIVRLCYIGQGFLKFSFILSDS